MSDIKNPDYVDAHKPFKYTKTKREKNPDTPEFVGKYYLTNATLYPAVCRAKAQGKMTEELGGMLLMLTRNYAKNKSFSRYTYRDDMVSEAMINLCKNALKFDSDKYTNAFSYFTTCIHNSFIQQLNIEKNHRRIRDKLLIEIGENPSFNYTDEYSAQAKEDGGLKEEFEDLKIQIEEAIVREKVEVLKDTKRVDDLKALKQAQLEESANSEKSEEPTIVSTQE